MDPKEGTLEYGSMEGLPRERKCTTLNSMPTTVAMLVAGDGLQPPLSRGKGGIGGLLARSHGYSGGNLSTHNSYHADGNGNITFLVDGSQAKAAAYRYDPFGNTISSSGTLASANVYRFSSKEIHVKSGMYYYLYRFYDPNLQRWINRDPLGEPGSELARRVMSIQWILPELSPNPYLFCFNTAIGLRDPFGLDAYADCLQKCKDEAGARHRDIDTCAKWALIGGSAAGGVVVGAGGAAKGHGLGGIVVGVLFGPIDAALVEVFGTAYSAARYLGCVTQCGMQAGVPVQGPIYPMPVPTQ
jgi:RHS repeat-associated protein